MAYPEILSLLAGQAAASPQKIALREPSGQAISYSQLVIEVRRLAQEIEGTAPAAHMTRSRTAIVLPNGVAMSLALLASAISGEAAPLNPLYTEQEFLSLFSLARIDRLVLLKGDTGHAYRAARAKQIPILFLDQNFSIENAHCKEFAQPKPDDIALVLMTSGSTGRPKIVPLSHANVCTSADDVIRSVALTPDDLCLSMWEQYHIGGLVDLLLAPLACGSQVFVAGSFNAPMFFKHVERVKPTWFQAVPTSLIDLVEQFERMSVKPDLSSLRFLRSVAAALPANQERRLYEAFGLPIIRTFGMTEAGPLITSTALPPLPQKPGSVGKSAGPIVTILNPAGEEVPRGETGEVAVKGANVFRGYENNDEANQISFRNGWFLTGDLGYFDPDGDLFLTGRNKEQVNRGGFKISPNEVESTITLHPAIKEAAVLGVSHPTLSEDLVAVVVAKASVTDADLKAYLKDHLVPYKIPSQIYVLPALPRNPVGKIDKIALAAMITELSKENFIAPKGPTETLIAKLWCQELHLSRVSAEIDFVAAGGDSLSAMRIVAALETALGQTIPDEIIESSQTIASFAHALEAAGLGLDEHDTTTVQSSQDLPSTNLGYSDTADNWRHSIDAVELATSVPRLKAALEYVLAYDTPSQILDALPQLQSATPNKHSSGRFDIISRFLLRKRYGRLLNGVKQEIRNVPEAKRWQRKSLTDAIQLYSADLSSAHGKIMLVGYTGNFLRLMMPTYRFLLALDPSRFDLLLLRDPSKSLFAKGLPDVGSSPLALAEYIDRLAKERGTSRIMAMGTSGGAFAALCGAMHMNWSAGIAVSSPSLAKHPEFSDLIDQLSKGAAANMGNLFILNGDHIRDANAGIELAQAIPHAKHRLMSEYATHNILHSAYQDGKLKSLLTKLLAGSESGS